MDKSMTIKGEEVFLANEEIKKILSELEANEDNLITFDLEETNYMEMLEELQTCPFFSDYKIILVNNPIFLEKSSGFDSLISYLKNPLDTSYLIINASGYKWNKENKYAKALELYTKIINIKAPSSPKLYALDYLKAQNVLINDDALEMLLERVSDIGMLTNELDKLIMYCDLSVIDCDAVSKLVSKSLEDDVYELSNAFINKNKKRVIAIYNSLLSHNEDPIRIMNVLEKKFLELLSTKVLVNEGYTKDQIASYFGYTQGRAYYLIKGAKEVKMDELKHLLDKISNLDYEIKSGRIDKNLGLTMFLLDR